MNVAARDSDYSALDEALEILAPMGPDLNNGFSNHAPMAIEALCAMRRGEDVAHWLDRYRRFLAPRRHARARITEADWRAALGDPRRTQDWFEFFSDQLEQHPWRHVLETWAPRLAPGLMAAATHGVIRAGHATRAIALADNPGRRRELADGLAYWASDYMTLPAERRPPGRSKPSDAIARVALLPIENRVRTLGSFTDALVRLDTFAPFKQTLDAVDPSLDASAFVSDLTATFARVYLANAHDNYTTIAFIHAVTGPAALRPMLPYLDGATARAALAYAWQAAAAMYATFGTQTRLPSLERRESARGDDAELVERAVNCGDEHAIKFTEVCLREHALNPDPAYLAAARHAVEMLSRTAA
ncbi:MAG TPA: questin oxidase family protein [Candidatus Acidoferrales bacterium]|nr:questin oxidase family protein [Candidatus Acidoferrales bacterium]